MIQIIKKAAFGLACITAFLLTSCDKTAHEIPEDAPDNGSTVTVGINTDAIGDTPFERRASLFLRLIGNACEAYLLPYDAVVGTG